jgi:hypothetical protein
MTRRGLSITFSLAGLVLLLFVGRWGASLLADHWWAQLISPEAGRFVVDWELLRLTLEIAGVGLACTWFIGHLLVVSRAIGSVQVPRQLANLEIQEALNARVLIMVGVGGGTLLGVVTGGGGGDWTSTVALAWTGVRYGETEPLLNHDLGLYLAQLPLWRELYGYALLLVLLGVAGVLTLYVIIGAVRWNSGRPAINDHARTHLGVLLACFALCLVWGYLLEPYELVADVQGNAQYGLFTFFLVTTQILAGTALAAAVLSLAWAVRGNHTLMAGGWTVLVAVYLIGHHVVPAFLGSGRQAGFEPTDRKRLEALAYGLTGLRDSVLTRGERPRFMPGPAALWPSSIVARLPSADSGEIFSAERAVLPVGRRPRPAWLLVRSDGKGASSVTAVSDDQTGLTGEPLYYPGGDSLLTTLPSSRLRLSRTAVWTGAPEVAVDSAPGGVRVGTGVRRLVLAWALQAGGLLGHNDGVSRVRWYLTPTARLHRLAPFATWGVPVPRLIGSELVWITDGYLASATFPLAARARWRGQRIGSLRADFVGVTSAESGDTRIYLRHTADKVAEAWRAVSDGVIQPAAAIPPEVGRMVPYPAEALQVQSKILEEQVWDVPGVVGRPDSLGGPGPAPEPVWDPDTLGTQTLVPYERETDRLLTAVLQARMADGWESLRLIRFDTTSTLPSPPVLENRWGRFPTFEQLRDSVLGSGGQLQAAPVRYWVGPEGLGAYQPHFAWNSTAGPYLVWVSVAVPGRGGAGHDVLEAWQNMLGLTAPLVAGAVRSNQLDEARRYMAAADSALRRGDLAAFGRAIDALRRILTTAEDRPKF